MLIAAVKATENIDDRTQRAYRIPSVEIQSNETWQLVRAAVSDTSVRTTLITFPIPPQPKNSNSLQPYSSMLSMLLDSWRSVCHQAFDILLHIPHYGIAYRHIMICEHHLATSNSTAHRAQHTSERLTTSWRASGLAPRPHRKSADRCIRLLNGGQKHMLGAQPFFRGFIRGD